MSAKLFDMPDDAKGPTAAFTRVWSDYPSSAQHPRRIDRARAFKLWRKFRLEERAAEILKLLETYKRSKQWQNLMYVPHICTWLNRQPWNDADPCAIQDKEAAHKEHLKEERKIAAENELASKIAAARAIKDDHDEMMRRWNLLPVEDRRTLILMDRNDHGFANEGTARKNWWARVGPI